MSQQWGKLKAGRRKEESQTMGRRGEMSKAGSQPRRGRGFLYRRKRCRTRGSLFQDRQQRRPPGVPHRQCWRRAEVRKGEAKDEHVEEVEVVLL